jgi:hypothetical protein
MAASNQTPPEYFTYDQLGHRGTGVFLRLIEGGGTIVSFTENLSYAECMAIGKAYIAFKWVPKSVATYLEVQAELCELVGEECKKSCSAKGCVCNPATSTCVDSSGNTGNNPGGNQSGRGCEQPGEVAGAH